VSGPTGWSRAPSGLEQVEVDPGALGEPRELTLRRDSDPLEVVLAERLVADHAWRRGASTTRV
jgi:hypothetical protein